jgi:hypothetical protein
VGRLDDFLIYGKPGPDWDEAIAPTGERFLVRTRPRGVVRLEGPYLGWIGVVWALARVPFGWLLHFTLFRAGWRVEAMPVTSDSEFRRLTSDSYASGPRYRVCDTSAKEASDRLNEVVDDIRSGRFTPGRNRQ